MHGLIRTPFALVQHLEVNEHSADAMVRDLDDLE